MKFTHNWLSSFIELSVDLDKVIEILSNIGLEVEEFEDKGRVYSQFSIAEIIETTSHPDADKLKVCKVNNGKEILQIVCGASNARAGIKVVLAPVGSIIPSNNMVIKASKIRGIESNGMLCSETELLVGNSSEGIIEILDSSLKPGMNFADSTGLNDKVIDINLTPNRGDCASIHGIARDLSATEVGVLKSKFVDFYKDTFDFGNSINDLDISIKNINCHEIAFCKIENIDNQNSLNHDVSSIFKLLDIKYHGALVDISNLSMYEFGRPNHMYDADKIKGNIEIRLSQEGEFFKSLDDKEYELPKDILVIADDEKILSIAGIIGGENSKVDENTKNILIEVANFNPEQISKSVRKLNIRTESSFRFERRIDYGNTASFMQYVSDLVIKHCGGKISGSAIIKGSELGYKKQMEINCKKINKLLGFEVKERDVNIILSHLGFVKIKDNLFNIPTWRQGDIVDNADIAEEVIRIKGTDYLQGMGCFYYDAQDLKHRDSDFTAIFKNTLVNRNIYEVISWSFINQEFANLFKENESIKIANPISNEFAIMRNSLIVGLLKIAKSNMTRGVKNISLFELGKIYYKSKADETIENNCLAIIRTGESSQKNIFSDQKKFDFYDLKDDFYSILNDISISLDSIITKKGAKEYHHPGKSASFYLGKNLIGYIGELHPKIIKTFGIKQSVICAEIFYDNLPKKNLEKRKPLFLSELQSINRDFAFYIDDGIESQEIIKSIKSLKINILEEINIFDVYKSDQDTSNKKSIAFNIKLQPIQKTLVDEEIEDISNKIINVVKEKLGGELRDSSQ